MNLIELHKNENEVSAINIFKGESGTAASIQLQINGTLKEHITRTPALLLCVVGLVTYEDETNKKVALQPGDYVLIASNVKHWLRASLKSQLILLK